MFQSFVLSISSSLSHHFSTRHVSSLYCPFLLIVSAQREEPVIVIFPLLFLSVSY